MKKLIKILSLIVSMIFSASAEENFYIDEYGSAALVSAKEAYPDFHPGPCAGGELPRVLDKVAVVIASEKQIKIDAVVKLFENNPRFTHVEIIFFSTNVSSDIADQPIGIANGRMGARNRINNIKKGGDLPKRDDAYVCAIENYFEAETTSAPRDHAYVVIQGPDGQFFEAVSVGVAIARAVYDDATKDAEPVMSDEGLFTGYSKTIGSYLEERYEFCGSDWFREVGAGIDRKDQILTTLDVENPWF